MRGEMAVTRLHYVGTISRLARTRHQLADNSPMAEVVSAGEAGAGLRSVYALGARSR